MKNTSSEIRTSLIISTYNRPQALFQVIESVKRQKMLPFEVIIADDGSAEETKELIASMQLSFPVPLIHSWHEDLGFRQAANKNNAASKAKGNYLIFVDGDLVMHPYFIQDNIRIAAPRQFVVNSRVMLDEAITNEIYRNNRFELSFFQLMKQKNFKNGFRLPWLSRIIPSQQHYKPCRGGLMAIWREDFLAVNGLNEDFVGWGHEDTDLFIRIMNYKLTRRNNKFRGITYHLYHPTENMSAAEKNKDMAASLLESSEYYTQNGIDKYEKVPQSGERLKTSRDEVAIK